MAGDTMPETIEAVHEGPTLEAMIDMGDAATIPADFDGETSGAIKTSSDDKATAAPPPGNGDDSMADKHTGADQKHETDGELGGRPTKSRKMTEEETTPFVDVGVFPPNHLDSAFPSQAETGQSRIRKVEREAAVADGMELMQTILNSLHKKDGTDNTSTTLSLEAMLQKKYNEADIDRDGAESDDDNDVPEEELDYSKHKQNVELEKAAKQNWHVPMDTTMGKRYSRQLKKKTAEYEEYKKKSQQEKQLAFHAWMKDEWVIYKDPRVRNFTVRVRLERPPPTTKHTRAHTHHNTHKRAPTPTRSCTRNHEIARTHSELKSGTVRHGDRATSVSVHRHSNRRFA